MNKIPRLFSVCLFVLSACSLSPADQRVQRIPVDTELVARLPHAEARAAPEEYYAVDTTLRLLGIEHYGVPGQAAAVIADKSTWNTSALHEGEALARNLTVTAIRPDGVELSGPGQRISLSVGGDAPARLVWHAFDTMVVREIASGEDVFSVDAAAMRSVADRYGADFDHVAVDRADVNGIGIRSVTAGSAAARLGLAAGDAILAIDGRKATAAGLQRVLAQLSSPATEAVRLQVVRAGMHRNIVFVTR